MQNDEVPDIMQGWREGIENLYEKLTDINKVRDVIDEGKYTTAVAGIENALLVNKAIHFGQCKCAKRLDEDNAESFMSGHRTCYTCLSTLQSNKKLKSYNKFDDLGWGISGNFDEQYSDDCSEDTSTDEDRILERRLSYTKHKILRKLRRSKPEAFELNCLDLNFTELLKTEIEDPDVRRRYIEITKASSRRDKVRKNKLQSTVSQNKGNFNVCGGWLFDFSNEVELKEKYSSTTFDFLTGVIHCYQGYLNQHPKERYISVSQLMLKSGNNVCKDEDDIVAHYYKVLHKKKVPKPKVEKRGNNFDSQRSVNNSDYPNAEKGRSGNKNEFLISEEEMNRIKRTGIVDLSGRSVESIPLKLWFLDKTASERRNTNERVPKTQSPKKNLFYKSITSLNLNNNKLSTFDPQGNSIGTIVSLSINNNRLTELPKEFGNLKTLRYLDLENNLLEVLPSSFSNLSSLVELNLQRNNLRILPINLGHLKKLVTMDLRWNKISQLPDSTDTLISLKTLNMGFNKLKYLPTDLCNLYSLIILDVSYNRLTEFPAFADMPNLILVNAMGNFIKEFPKFSNCKSLCEIRLDANRFKIIVTQNLQDTPVVQLTLSYNKLEYLPDDLFLVETLVLLDVTSNRLTHLPYSLARLKYLTCIKLEENHIQNISKEILDAGSKKVIDFLLYNLLQYEGDNNVTKVAKKDLEGLYVKGENSTTPINKKLILDPKEVEKSHAFVRRRLELTDLKSDWIKIAKQKKVSIVDLSKNKFRYIPAGLKSLRPWIKELTFRENQLKTIPDFIGRMENLTILDLSFNNLETLPLSMRTCNLTKLVCRRNMFQSIPRVVYLIQNVEHLDFSENNIKEIDVDGLRNLRKLRYLNLSKNEIKVVPNTLGYLTNIKNLELFENPFRRPGYHILRSGTQAILEYLKKH